MIGSGDLKKGITIELDGRPYQVLDYQHIKLGRGSAQVRTRLRDLISGHTIEKVFQASEKFLRAKLEYRPMQYLYNDAGLYYFMDTETFEQAVLTQEQLGEAVNYLKEGLVLEVLNHRNEPVGIELPVAVELRVTETGPGFKGDTATGSGKPAKLETGITIQVPFFVNTGDVVKVDTRTGKYLERVS